MLDVAGAVPALVRNAARVLAGSVERYVFMSTISAYRDWPYQPVDESSPLWDGDPDLNPTTRRWDPDAYGPLKVGCELAIRREFAESTLFIRPLGDTAPIGAVVHRLAAAIEDGRDLPSMSGVLVGTAYRLLLG
ncbi:hypothetical protein [Sphaerimonospora mesophila]|uniref:hypothetical protein n=1 Tax=Sphaerimonospora mesophila TaxID=37483 RepID=UPI0006E33574